MAKSIGDRPVWKGRQTGEEADKCFFLGQQKQEDSSGSRLGLLDTRLQHPDCTGLRDRLGGLCFRRLSGPEAAALAGTWHRPPMFAGAHGSPADTVPRLARAHRAAAAPPV